MAEKKEVTTVKPIQETMSKTVVAPVTITPSPVREDPPLTPPPPPPPPKKSDPPKKVVEEKPEEESQPALINEVKQPPIVRKVTKQLYPQPPVNQIPRQTSPPPTPSRKEVPRLASSEPRKKQPFVLPETGERNHFASTKDDGKLLFIFDLAVEEHFMCSMNEIPKSPALLSSQL